MEFTLPISTTEVSCSLGKVLSPSRTWSSCGCIKSSTPATRSRLEPQRHPACRRNILAVAALYRQRTAPDFSVPAAKQHRARAGEDRPGYDESLRLLAEATIAMGRPLVSGRHGRALQQHHREQGRVARLSSAVPRFQANAEVHSAERPMVLRTR